MIQGRPIRAGFITPSLYWGGAERWLHDLALFTQGIIYWTGCAVTHPLYQDNTMRRKIGQLMPIFGYGRKAVQHVAQAADVMIAWGTDGLKELVNGYEGKVVFVAHGSGPFDHRVARYSISGATHLAAVSQKATDSYKGLTPLEDIAILYNGINPDRCQITRPRAEVRDTLSLGKNEFAVGYLGRLAPEKNLITMAKAIKILPERFRGVWVGDGYDEENQKNAIRREIGSRAIFHPRVEHVGNYLQAFDAFVLVSPTEGFSLSILEAMLVGVPVVCTNVGAMPELERRHGRRWESVSYPTTARDLAEAILRIEAMSQEARLGMTQDCRKIVEGDFLAGHMAARWMKYLNRIMGDGQ